MVALHRLETRRRCDTRCCDTIGHRDGGLWISGRSRATGAREERRDSTMTMA